MFQLEKVEKLLKQKNSFFGPFLPRLSCLGFYSYNSQLLVFREDFRRGLLAGAAAGGHAKFRLQAPQILRTVFGGLADLFIGDRVADADIHKINQLAC